MCILTTHLLSGSASQSLSPWGGHRPFLPLHAQGSGSAELPPGITAPRLPKTEYGCHSSMREACTSSLQHERTLGQRWAARRPISCAGQVTSCLFCLRFPSSQAPAKSLSGVAWLQLSPNLNVCGSGCLPHLCLNASSVSGIWASILSPWPCRFPP